MQTGVFTTRRQPQRLRSQSVHLRSPARVLLLTSGLGYGHLRAAQAVEAALLQRSVTVETLDLWSLMNQGAASIIHQTYLRLVQEYPQLYERLYHLDEHTWRQILQSEAGPPAEVLEVLELIAQIADSTVAAMNSAQYVSDRLLLSMLFTALPYDKASLAGNGIRARLALIQWTWLRLSKRLQSLVAQFEPDVIVSTQMIPAAMIASLKQRRRLNVPLVGVLTDYGLHDFWRQAGVERYCLAHESMASQSSAKAGDDFPGTATVTGVPLMPAFANPMSQQEARRQLGIGSPHGLGSAGHVVLVLGGGLGLSVDAIAAQLLHQPADTFLIVMPGKNAKARAALTELTATHSNKILVCDWTERMDVFIRAADVVVGKPGGVSVAEVLACGRPLFATRSLGGQEGFNVRFLERHDVGALVPECDLAAHVNALLSQPERLASMQQRAWSLGRRDGAGCIGELVLDLAWLRQSVATVREH